jgi:hypothetical protein
MKNLIFPFFKKYWLLVVACILFLFFIAAYSFYRDVQKRVRDYKIVFDFKKNKSKIYNDSMKVLIDKINFYEIQKAKLENEHEAALKNIDAISDDSLQLEMSKHFRTYEYAPAKP